MGQGHNDLVDRDVHEHGAVRGSLDRAGEALEQCPLAVVLALEGAVHVHRLAFPGDVVELLQCGGGGQAIGDEGLDSNRDLLSTHARYHLSQLIIGLR